MKRITITLITLFLTNIIFCQDNINYQEKTVLNIDRSIYVSGETINFSVSLISDYPDLSKVIYVELITSNGNQLYGGKYLIENKICTGTFTIPEELISGNYYVRAYTKYMRNYSSYNYSYQLIKIINPNKKDVLNIYKQNDTLSTINLINNNTEEFKISIPNNTFKKRQTVHVKIKTQYPDSLENITISVVPEGSLKLSNITSDSKNINSDQYIPETRGITLTGLLKGKNSQQPIKRGKVNLTILNDSINSFYSVLTNNNGNFYFALPTYYGSKEMYISAQKKDSLDPEILIDNDFCSQNISLPNPEFSLTPTEQDIAYQLVVNSIVNKHFTNKKESDKSLKEKIENINFPFYGQPTYSIIIDNFVELPKFEDYFSEIPSWARIRKSRGKNYIKILGTHPEMSIYEPLIMVDFTPVYNVDDILEIIPKKVQRIDIINLPYIRVNIKYGGILNIVSNENDFANVKLPNSGMFLNYKFFKKDSINHTHNPIPENYPDARNTLYWNPVISPDKDGSYNLSFKTSDSDGPYIIQVVGIDKNGEKYISSKTFNVK